MFESCASVFRCGGLLVLVGIRLLRLRHWSIRSTGSTSERYRARISLMAPCMFNAARGNRGRGVGSSLAGGGAPELYPVSGQVTSQRSHAVSAQPCLQELRVCPNSRIWTGYLVQTVA